MRHLAIALIFSSSRSSMELISFENKLIVRGAVLGTIEVQVVRAGEQFHCLANNFTVFGSKIDKCGMRRCKSLCRHLRSGC
mmetsp:Transcript_4269/g.10600  ORF Transcript_4269/g.10600 Transcript_4269/m.10600 type:complete len:81 (-) Transcript_4269:135-377(-)